MTNTHVIPLGLSAEIRAACNKRNKIKPVKAMDDNNIMQNVEDLVCHCVSDLMTQRRGVEVKVTSQDVYDGKKNVPFARIAARGFIFNLLHNCFGFPYSVISQRSGMKVTSIMRSVRKCRDLTERDNLYREISDEIDKKLFMM